MPVIADRGLETWWTTEELATHLKVSREYIRRMVRDGDLIAHRLQGGSYRISSHDLRAWLVTTRTGVRRLAAVQDIDWDEVSPKMPNAR